MDWNAAIEKNREALKRVLAMLVAMAGLSALTSPLAGEDGSARRGEAEALAEPGEGCFPRAPTLPRHLHRAVLALLRPAEAAARRLIIVAARGIVVALPPAPQRKPEPAQSILRNGIGTGIVLPAGFPSPLRGLRGRSSDRASGSIAGREGRGDCEAIGGPGEARGGGPTAGTPSVTLLDPLRPFRPRPERPIANGIARISLPGVTAPFPVTPRRAPSPDDPIDAARLALRLGALARALDDLPREARRYARWKARRDRALAAGRIHRVTPLRPGRPPGGRLSRYDPDAPRRADIRDVDEILAHTHALACYALSPDTS